MQKQNHYAGTIVKQKIFVLEINFKFKISLKLSLF